MKNETYAADWVLPIVSPPIRQGAIAVHRGKVVWVGPLTELPDGWERPAVWRGIITPGLVNAHTHLQYTGFQQLGQATYRDFEHWSDAFGEVYDSYEPSHWHAAALRGARLAIRAGTTAFAEIVTSPQARGAVAACGASGVEYLEAIGESDRTWQGGGRDAFLARLNEDSLTALGISPHAPYSLDGGVISDLVAIARTRGIRIHSHLAESSREADLYRSGDGSVLTVYSDLRDEFELVRTGGTGQTTGEYADTIGLLTPTCHVAHGIYLDRRNRDLLLRRHTQVALCPRSNATIGLDEAPVAAYLHEGHEIAVGTDSLASAPSLDLMADVRALEDIARRQGYREPDLARRLIRAATYGGAEAIGFAASGHGALIPGGPADFALFDVAADSETSAYENLVRYGAGNCALTVASGMVLHGPEIPVPSPPEAVATTARTEHPATRRRHGRDHARTAPAAPGTLDAEAGRSAGPGRSVQVPAPQPGARAPEGS